MERGKFSLWDQPEARQLATWLIRDYPRIKAKLEELDGYGAGTDLSARINGDYQHSRVESIAIRREPLRAQLKAVELAFEKIPDEYRKGLWEAITARNPYPVYSAVKTWKKWRQRLIYWTAYYAGYLDQLPDDCSRKNM